ncbi:DUF998 domain-containing protein [Stenotrophomonas sp. C3(2023)]|uniref:DUF998 domain-containing protein n=1 Tax=Stenotrophomonas sp. C3(2023) TaxID=3080277 RepID=UPI00293C505B|nr:DUF998 domain-containing protein [Stenotrophomonas sp. C3(2023)]MDV3468132.1 DUF998 domain-containing protein [Stenotrophomonas sp. C3(2023)]
MRASAVFRLPGPLAAVLFVVSVVGFGAALPGYLQGRHPVALLGAGGMPHALAFNLLAWILPGLLAAMWALHLRARLPRTAAWSGRLGAQMLVVAALAFAGMGLLPLQVEDLDGLASQLHASAWMVWVLGFVAGALLLAAGVRRQAGGLALLSAGCAVLAAVAGFGLQGLVAQPLAQRVVFGAWLLWLAVAPQLVRRWP